MPGLFGLTSIRRDLDSMARWSNSRAGSSGRQIKHHHDAFSFLQQTNRRMVS
jgi:hypothetical protein